MSTIIAVDNWDLKTILIKRINTLGGFTNCHSHFDRAFTISPTELKKASLLMEKKWQLVDKMKRKSSEEDFYLRIKRCLDLMISQGVKNCSSFIDIDPIVEFRALNAAKKIKKDYIKKINFLIVNQTLKGVLDSKARAYIEKAIDDVDIIGGLPSKDRPHAGKHIDYILNLAKHTGKNAHLHIDQENNPKEKDTELLAKKIIQHKVQGKVTSIHSVSLAAQDPKYRKKVYSLMKEAQLSVIICPSAAVNMKEVPYKSYVHKPIAPVAELVENGIIVGLGLDNILDIYEPFLDGDLWFETRLLIEISRYYNLEKIAEIASVNGKKILGLP